MKTHSNLNLSNHAVCRAQQRGVSIATLEFIMFHADVWLHAREGCRTARISQKRLGRLSREGLPAPLVERATNVVLVIDPDFNRIVTVLHDDGAKKSRRYRTQWPNRTCRPHRTNRRRKSTTRIAFGPYPKGNEGVTFH
jgi:hypothetical protein